MQGEHNGIVKDLLLDALDADDAHLAVGRLDVLVSVYRPELEAPAVNLFNKLVYERIGATVFPRYSSCVLAASPRL